MAGYWWIWMVAGVLLAAVEVLLPGWIFLGFALGAAMTGLALLVLPGLAGSPALLWLAFALLSLLAWALLRARFGRKGEVTIWKRDINDD